MFQVNFTVVLIFVSLIPFMVLMKEWFFDPILKVQTQRRNELEDDEKAALSYVTEAFERRRDQEEQLKSARRRIQEWMAAIKRKVRDQLQQELVRFRSQQDQLFQQDQQVVNTSYQVAREQIQQRLAQELAQDIVARFRQDLQLTSATLAPTPVALSGD
jgi:F-type H+-transporting ATPase subunit b